MLHSKRTSYEYESQPRFVSPSHEIEIYIYRHCKFDMMCTLIKPMKSWWAVRHAEQIKDLFSPGFVLFNETLCNDLQWVHETW